MTSLVVAAFMVLVVLAFLVASSLRNLRADERGVVFRLGRLRSPARGPGVILLAPIIDKMVRVSLRPARFELSELGLLTSDGVLIELSALVQMRIVDPQRAIVEVENFLGATAEAAKQTLRNLIAERRADEVRSQQADIESLAVIRTNELSADWGVQVDRIEVSNVNRSAK